MQVPQTPLWQVLTITPQWQLPQSCCAPSVHVQLVFVVDHVPWLHDAVAEPEVLPEPSVSVPL